MGFLDFLRRRKWEKSSSEKWETTKKATFNPSFTKANSLSMEYSNFISDTFGMCNIGHGWTNNLDRHNVL
jgi:hypothetical protein